MHYYVVDGDELHLGQSEPAGLSSARDAVVHDVVGDQEEGLQELNAPAEHCRLTSILSFINPLVSELYMHVK